MTTLDELRQRIPVDWQDVGDGALSYGPMTIYPIELNGAPAWTLKTELDESAWDEAQESFYALDDLVDTIRPRAAAMVAMIEAFDSQGGIDAALDNLRPSVEAGMTPLGTPATPPSAPCPDCGLCPACCDCPEPYSDPPWLDELKAEWPEIQWGMVLSGEATWDGRPLWAWFSDGRWHVRVEPPDEQIVTFGPGCLVDIKAAFASWLEGYVERRRGRELDHGSSESG